MNCTLVRCLLRAYPSAWRERYGQEFEDLLHADLGGPRTVFDVLRSALRERWSPPPHDRRAAADPSAIHGSVAREIMMSRRLRLLMLLLPLLLIPCHQALAGPPYQLDDPDVIPYHWHEFYVWGGVASSPGVVNTAGPAIEFNWSLIPNTMFHFIAPLGASIPSRGPTTFGPTDGEFGFQMQFLPETKHRPMIGTFLMMELPWGQASRGLGAGRPSWKIPLYAKKTIGAWSIDGGGGVNISDEVPGGRNYPFGGTIINYEVSRRLTVGPELFAHGRSTADPALSQYAVDLDFGGYYTFNPQHPGFQFLFAYGHSVAGQTENYGYVALYWTWGPATADRSADERPTAVDWSRTVGTPRSRSNL